jgi:hypothetical protein
LQGVDLYGLGEEDEEDENKEVSKSNDKAIELSKDESSENLPKFQQSILSVELYLEIEQKTKVRFFWLNLSAKIHGKKEGHQKSSSSDKQLLRKFIR